MQGLDVLLKGLMRVVKCEAPILTQRDLHLLYDMPATNIRQCSKSWIGGHAEGFYCSVVSMSMLMGWQHQPVS